ncbi:MAG: hypothetical protein WEB00_09285 [Dehalococcoidia bacterium]
MADDRILFMPPVWAPDPEVFESWPAYDALLERFRAHWPVDFLRWPTLVGEPAEGNGWEVMANAVRKSLTDEHHVIGLWLATPIVKVLAELEPRSLVVKDFGPNPGTLEAAGLPALASLVRAAFAISATPAQSLPSVMHGADQEFLRRAVEAVERTLDKGRLLRLLKDPLEEVDAQGSWTLRVPALLLTARGDFIEAGLAGELFRVFAPAAQVESVRHGYRWHERGPGEEFADKAIPFIEGVIAGES